ncbi:DUF2851 family protein [Pontibacter sp. G13]|uniref:DUF2851 family protein n=1 Tax=Pontibacter sp. G13 TaxID=3074898 RepID=UPI002889FC50|nr:DUF2851 family protein [Pontibacter sp. G13]WNJ16085.1 DUF2851 family protein [Pontibacter sp. G13]
MNLPAKLPEHFLHWVWKNLCFDLRKLRTTTGLPIFIHQPGQSNPNQGPDFLNAELKIGHLKWVGHVEIHLSSQDWYAHRHDQDPHYDNTVLHVVWETNGKPVMRSDLTAIPEVAIGHLIDPYLVTNFDRLTLSESQIACASQLNRIPTAITQGWLTRMGVERLSEKVGKFQARLSDTHTNWEQVIWESMAYLMGGPVNGPAFLHLAQWLPYQIVRKYAHDQIILEALLFGGMGFCRGLTPSSNYEEMLLRNWTFLQHKHEFTEFQPFPLKYLRMRPAEFPTIRISQLAAIIHLFPRLSDGLTMGFQHEWEQAVIHASPYWQAHTRFGKSSKSRDKHLGACKKQMIWINLWVPMMLIYQERRGEIDIRSWAVDNYSTLQPESNRITRKFKQLGIDIPDALSSQGAIQLYKSYCVPKHCLKCAIGHQLLRRTNPSKS